MIAEFGRALLVALTLSVGLQGPVRAHADPFGVLDQLVSDPAAQGLVGIDVRKLSGEVLYARHANRLFTPASALKLLTAYTALRRLGPETRFKTELLAEGAVKKGVLHGNLWFKGSGDPTLRAANLAEFAAVLQVKGIRRITGDLIADASQFVGPRYPSGWMWDDLERPFAAPVSALSLDGNATEESAITEAPERWAALQLADRLKAAGIELAGTVRVGQVPSETPVWHVHWSPPVSELIRALNKDSNNFVAETLVRQLGLKQASGSHEAGLTVMREAVSELGWRAGSYRLADGSGLSRYNAVSPAQLAELLLAARRMPESEAFLASLPIAGVDGTLAHRMRGSRAEGTLAAKTGTMSSVCALAGYLNLPGREPVVVVMVVNGFAGSAQAIRAQQEAWLEALIEAID